MNTRVTYFEAATPLLVSRLYATRAAQVHLTCYGILCLVSDAVAWITGQVIHSRGGF